MTHKTGALTALTAPGVSVLMAVHNGGRWLSDAVASVSAQTAGDLELIVIDDGSTDETSAILAAVRDPRVRVERRARAGLTRSLNRALRLARAPLVARLDADDLALPARLARQRAFLDSHPDIGLLGTGARVIDADGEERGVVRPPEDDRTIRRVLIHHNPFVHSSVMMRRAVVEAVGRYDESFAVAQDYDLWLRLAAVTRLANLAEALVIRRLVPGRVTAERDGDRLRAEVRARWSAVRRGTYPPWCVGHVVRPVLALALPLPLRRALRGGHAG